jgi:DNA-binding SARP family transcriptional activator/DNA-binding CsgD family transcriptional regulator
MRIRLLGPIEVLVDGAVRPVRGLRRKAVLAVLALRRGEIVSVDALMEIVWGDARPSIHANTLQSHVSHLRTVFGDRTVILARPPGYLLQLPARSTDVEVAEDLVKQATRSVDPAQRAAHLRAALRLWRGQPFADVAGVTWLEEQGQHLDQLWLQATRALVEARLALGEHAALIPELERLTGEHPLDEQLHGQLMLALYRGNRQAEALAVFRRLRRTLADELGIDPNQALRELEAAMLRQDTALHSALAPTAPRAEIRLGDSEVIGRDPELAALRTAVAGGQRALFVVGEPGIGKSRLAAEAARFADELEMVVLRGRAASSAVQFRALREALLATLRRAGPPDDPQLRPYLPALARLVPEWRVHGPAGVDDSLVVLAEAVLRLLISLGRRGGCVLVLEDLHDADADTLAVVDYLVDNAATNPLEHPFVLIGTARTTPSAAIDLIRAAKRRQAAAVLELRGLDDAAVRRLAGACLGVPADDVPAPTLDRLLDTADGVPLHVEELLAGMVDDGALVREGARWAVRGPMTTPLRPDLVATLTGRVDRLDPDSVAVLRAGALFGRRFPAPHAAAAAEVDDETLLRCLRAAVDAQLLVPEQDPHWYGFRHALTSEALHARLLPIERQLLARRVAESIDRPAGAPFDGWERVAGELWAAAGEPERAAHRLGDAGRRAAAYGAVTTGITLLERALSIAPAVDDLALRIAASLVDAYANAGRVEDAYGLSARLEAPASVAPELRAAVHMRLARVAEAAGHWQRGLDEVARARALLGAQQDPALDAVEAELVLGNPSPDRYPIAARLAERALRGGAAAGRPEVECSALATLGRIARLRDLADADALYERGFAVAEAHHLVAWRVNLLYNLGADDGIRRADPDRLTAALAAAEEAGAVVNALDITLELAIVRICRSEYDAAEAAALRVEQTATRLKLERTRLIALGERVMVAAHQGRRAEAAALMSRFRDLGGEDDDFASAVRGFGLAIGHLLHEDPGAATEELDAAVERETQLPTPYLSFVHGPHLLLSVLSGRSGRAACARLAGSVQGQAGWNRLFVLLAEAVVSRGGAAMARFFELSHAYPTARHLGLRLVAPRAIADGWGEPVSWLRASEAYFHDTAPPVARACRDLLRTVGTPVPQHRRGSASLPPAARERGITVREFEVLGLLAAGLNNQDVSRRLFLSPRTVEKHVASLLAKTGAADRSGLVAFAADVSGAREYG